ncbi:AMP-binding protein [Phytohabitans sp. ZYX-F-186]|uniref:AMP-binding protein n=1 Tax=Phytohabitans maris TaxID=3071409 RepID=A0ABU0ZW47_9ACTN|nr:AMP-binding protein [Phytohabitans sp. ZYX-F-186]MDQ7911264.1 AMP-binding protein [Phytohabitans sp. ZYX-F-186]
MTDTVAGTLAGYAERLPDTPFLKIGEGPWVTYGELEAATDRVAAGLRGLGVGAGDRVAVVCLNRLEAIELLFACAKIGAILVPLNYHLRGEFLRYQLTDCGATTLVVDGPGAAMADGILAKSAVRTVVTLDEPRPGGTPYAALAGCADPFDRRAASASDLVSIIYSSGTTGLPKGCMLSNGYYVNAGRAVGPAGFVVPGDRVLTAFPHFHVSLQLNTLMSALVNDASIVIEPEFHASTFMARAAAEEATMLWGLGTMATAILARPASPTDRDHKLRLCVFAPLSAERQVEFAERFGCLVNAEAYGQTEAVPITISQADRPTRVPFAEGTESILYEVRVVDAEDREVPPGQVGEIVVRPRRPNAMYSGYWGRPEATVAAMRNLWHHTGDLGTMDPAGQLVFVDRAKDAIRRRGENVSCYQLEWVVGQHPAVAEAAVTAVPSPLGEDDIKLSVVLRTASAPTPEQWFEFFKAKLPYFALPRYLDVRASMPRTATGRVRKDAILAEGVHEDLWDLEAMGLVVARHERRG